MQDKKSLSSSEELEIPKSNRLIYDWVSLSTRKHAPSDIIDLIGMRGCPWEVLSSGKGYTHKHYYGGVSISFCGNNDMTLVDGFYLLEMSGQGCRTFETYGNGDYEKLFNLVLAEQGKDHKLQDVRLTRLDVAFDDMTGLLDINLICDKTRMQEFVSRIHSYEVIYGSKGNSVNFGRKGSNVFIRIYDKAMERGYKDGRHWIRCELQLRHESACGYVYRLRSESMAGLYSGVLKNYLSFKEVSSDSNKSRWPEASFWTAFLNDSSAISIVDRPGVEYNLAACEKYLLTQPLGTIQTLIALYGSIGFYKMVKAARSPSNPKYRQLIADVEYQRKHPTVVRGNFRCEMPKKPEWKRKSDDVPVLVQDCYRADIAESDDDIVLLSEFADELRAEYDQIARESEEKRILSKRESDRIAATEYLKNHGLDLSDI